MAEDKENKTERECECKSTTYTFWPSGDFGTFIGIALLVLAAGYAGCEDSQLRAKGRLIEQCRKAMAAKEPIPEMCTVVVKQ